MDRCYTRPELEQLAHTMLEPLIGKPVLVGQTVLLAALVNSFRDMVATPTCPEELRAFVESADVLRLKLLDLCLEGPYDGLPVA